MEHNTPIPNNAESSLGASTAKSETCNQAEAPAEEGLGTAQNSPLSATLPAPALQALRWFYDRLTLLEADGVKLWADRGLTVNTCSALGFKSNPQANKEILLEMEKHFPVSVLVDCGLWSVAPGDATAQAKPNAQFYGMSLVEKRDERGKKVRDKKPRFYVVRTTRDWRKKNLQPSAEPVNPQYGIVTEGEFKAAALWQVFGEKAAVGAMPGITLARTLQSDIEEWLSAESVGVRQVVVGYDNEEKGNPKLPGYIEEEWKRFEVTVWARLLARQLGREGWDARVCVLPKDWRDAKGKADWDGRLAQRLDAEHERTGKDGTELWAAVRVTIYREWEAVLKTARPVHELYQAGFFDSKEERLIHNRLKYLLYEPRLPVGGEAELATSRRLLRLGPKLRDRTWFPDRMRAFLHVLAKKYGDLNGVYYVFKPLRDKAIEDWQGLMLTARERNESEVARACEVALKGTPNRITDFYMKAHYVLRRQNATRHRLVTLHNIHGVTTELTALPSEPFSTPTKFRQWLLDAISGGSWMAGERELQALHADIGREVAYKDVVDVVQRGYHEDSKCWFFGDVTYSPAGKELLTGKHGIVWVHPLTARAAEEGEPKERATAYKISERDHEAQSFRHKEPRMCPEVQATEAEVAQLFHDLCLKMFETVGSHAAFLALGTVFACGAGPEIYAAHTGFPGLWVHGEPRQGKSSIARWLMAIWGFNVDTGLALKDCTKVGLSIALQQYGNLPIWLEEYQANAPEWMTYAVGDNPRR